METCPFIPDIQGHRASSHLVIVGTLEHPQRILAYMSGRGKSSQYSPVAA